MVGQEFGTLRFHNGIVTTNRQDAFMDIMQQLCPYVNEMTGFRHEKDNLYSFDVHVTGFRHEKDNL